MNEPADARIRRRALEAGGSFIVQAPAGSGKTELLIRRFLTLLGSVSDPEEVVAITFTKKAAAEMRERVMKAMADAQKPRPPGKPQQELWDIAALAWDNNKKRRWLLERFPMRLRIQTIDALCAALTRQMPWLSRFGAPLQIAEDAGELYRAAALHTLHLLTSEHAGWSAAVSVLLAHLDNNVNRAVEMLTDMLRSRDQWLRHLGPTIALDEQKSRAVIETAWEEVVSHDLLSISSDIAEDHKGTMVECAVYAAQQLLASGSDSAITAWRGCGTFIDATPQHLAQWRGLGELLLTEQGQWRRRIDKNIGFPAAKNQTAVEMKEKMQVLLAALAGDEPLRDALDRIRRLPNAGLDDQQWRILYSLTLLLPLAAARLNLVFSDKARVDFAEVNMGANRALGSLESPSDLALRLQHRISHLLVDEFQDTSLTQFELIERLTAGWAPGDGRTLFLVGDPMQSIYRFREAEVGLFLRVQEQGIGDLKPEPLTLSVNFRSDKKLVEWVNETFAACFPATADARLGAVGFARSEAWVPSRQPAGVVVHPLFDAPPAAEAQRVVEIVRRTRAHDREQTMAILVRARSSLQEILPALDRAGMAYSGLDILGLTWRPVVQDLMSLTLALVFPADRIAWLSILRAPWCGLVLNDLHVLAGVRERVCIWECVQDEALMGRLTADGQARLSGFKRVVGEALANRSRSTLRRWVENTWIGLGGPACTGEHELENARLFFELLEDYQRRVGIEDLTGFSRAVAERWAQTENAVDQRLQIMTLHKAKGLEFDTVIIPGMHRPVRPDDPRLLLWEEQVHDGDESLLLAPSSATGPGVDRHYEYLRRVQRDKEHFERLRLLYVGCTRARRNLHLLGTLATAENGELRPPRGQSFLARLWGRLQQDFERSRVQQFELFDSTPEKTPAPALRRLPSAWRLPDFPTSVEVGDHAPELGALSDDIEFSWVGETARHIGVVVHDLLQHMAEDGVVAWSEGRLARMGPVLHADLTRLGVADDEAADASRRICAAFAGVLSDPRARWLLSNKRTDAKTEYAVSVLSAVGVRSMRMDRTFIDSDGTRWIIDYKSSTHEGTGEGEFLDREQQRYRHQLDGYAEALQAMEPGRPIKLGLYFPMLKGWREWDYL